MTRTAAADPFFAGVVIAKDGTATGSARVPQPPAPSPCCKIARFANQADADLP
jgi:hypothetical protein